MTYDELLAKINQPPKTQAENSKKWYEKKKAEALALGIPVTKLLHKSPYDSEKRKAYYQKQKAEGTLKNYYQTYKAKDPLYNQKVHIKRKAKDPQWQTARGDRNNFRNWVVIVEHIRESELSNAELVRELSTKWRVLRHTANRRNDESKTIYRPRLTNTVLTDEQVKELDNFALTQGLTSQHMLIRSTVSYSGELRNIDSREEDKEVDVWTVQKKNGKLEEKENP